MTSPQHPHDPTSREHDQLRALLQDAVADVEPPHALDEIRARTRTGSSPRPWAWAGGGALVAAAATVAAFAVLSGGSGTPDAGPGFAGTTATAQPAPDTRDVTVPVYYVGDTSHGPRLFRESYTENTSDSPAELAVSRVLAGTAADPDYASPWQGSGIEAGCCTTHAGGVITVALASGSGDPSQRPSSMDAATARLALQQLVFSVQDALDSTDPVQFTVDGTKAETLVGEPVTQPVARGSADDVLAQVQISSPLEGASVASPFTVEGVAAAFEANVQWELMQGDSVVQRGFTTAAECCTLAPYSFEVTAPAGDYTLVVHDEDASGGGEGLPPWQDTKNVSVR